MTPTEQPRHRLIGAVTLALIATVSLFTLLRWAPAHGQDAPQSPLALPIVAAESPLPTPAPAADPLVQVPLPSLTGSVHDQAGAPLGSVELMLYRRQLDQWELVRQSTTAATGEFRFPWLNAGVYRLLAQDPTGTHARTFYPAAADVESAPDILVTGATPAPLDFGLVAASRITGTVEWPNGPAPFDTTVNLYLRTQAPIATRFSAYDVLNGPPEITQWRWVASRTYTETLVGYVFDGLAAGTYRVCAEGVSLRETIAECYDNAALPTYAAGIVVSPSQTISNVTIWLGDGADLAVITGTVTTPDGAPAPGVRVELLPVAADPTAQGETFAGETDAAGAYRIAKIPAGRYTLQFIDPKGVYFLNAYRATPDEPAPTVLEIAPRDARQIDGVVVKAGMITGNVTLDGAIAGVGGDVYAYRQTEVGPLAVVGRVVAATGAFTVAGLADGAYWLQFQLPIANNLYYGGMSAETATLITVTAGQVVPNVVYDLLPVVAAQPTGAISGTVTAGGAPRPDIRVEVYGFSPDCCTPPPPLAYAVTDAEGRFSLSGLPFGTYKLGFVDPNETLATVYSGATIIYETAATVQIGNPADGVSRQFVDGITADLVMGGAVARSVRRADDSPVARAGVRIYQAVGDPGQYPQVGSTTTDATGRYGFIRLAPGAYHVCITAEGMDPATYTCQGRSGTGIGVDITVEAGALSSGVDVVAAP